MRNYEQIFFVCSVGTKFWCWSMLYHNFNTTPFLRIGSQNKRCRQKPNTLIHAAPKKENRCQNVYAFKKVINEDAPKIDAEKIPKKI